VIVVDDASADNTAREADRPFVKLIRRDKSGGYAGACADGYAESSGDWIAVLNADTRPHEDWLYQLERAAHSGERTGMAASMVTLEKPRDMVDSAGIEVMRSGMVHLRGHGEIEAGWREPDLVEVFGPAGSAAMYSRAMLEDIGFFDPSYYIYYEDADLAWRARWAGWRCVLSNRARVIHRHSYTMAGASAKKRRLLQTNRLRTVVRNWPAAWMARWLPLLAAYDCASVGRALGEGNLAAAVRARLDFFSHLSSDLVHRKRIMQAGKESPQRLARWFKKSAKPWREGA